MKKILLISDTHGHFPSEIQQHAQNVDEVWHAGDWGSLPPDSLLDQVVLRGVYGNIDGIDIRQQYPETLIFSIEGLQVYITHIGGYPGRYAKGIKKKLIDTKPDLFICGHSHICKVMKDKDLDLWHFNSGAIGFHGFHKKRTMLLFSIENGKLFDMKLLEYDK